MAEKASLAGQRGFSDDVFAGGEGGEAVGLVEVSGAIKWFDVAKGYGFILPDGGEMATC